MAATPGQAQAGDAYIVAARRTALGRVGGLHRQRRVEELAVPVIAALLRDAGLGAEAVESVVCGTTLAGGNPARRIALAAGLQETTQALTIDRDTASGLDAILIAAGEVAAGRVAVAVAGGADSVSTAPWRIARPKTPFQMPHFMPLEGAGDPAINGPEMLEDLETFARHHGFDRARQDQWTHGAFARAEMAREQRRLVGEIVPLRATTEEARDESAIDFSARDIAEMPHLLPPAGTVTRAALAAAHDGAAAVLIVSEPVWHDLGRPSALRILGRSALGTGPEDEIAGAALAIARIRHALDLINPAALGIVELAERSSIEALALVSHHGLDPALLNPAGGAVVRGHAGGATGAVLVVRLFTELIRQGEPGRKRGTAALAAAGGLAVAALFEVVR